jgi:hypothetical protein
LVIEVPIQIVYWPPNYNYLVFFSKTFAQVSNILSDIAQVSIGLEYAGHSTYISHCILEALPVTPTMTATRYKNLMYRFTLNIYLQIDLALAGSSITRGSNRLVEVNLISSEEGTFLSFLQELDTVLNSSGQFAY